MPPPCLGVVIGAGIEENFSLKAYIVIVLNDCFWPITDCLPGLPQGLLRPNTSPTGVTAGQVVLPPAATLRPILGFVLGKCVCSGGPLRVAWGPDGDPDLSGFPPDADVGA